MVNVKLSRQVELHSSKAILEMWCLVWHDFHWPMIGLDGSSPSPASNIWVPAALLPHLTPESPLGSNSWIKPDKDCCCCLVAQSCLTLCDPMNRSTPGFLVLRHLQKFAQTHVHWIGDAIQPSHPLSSPSPPALNLSQHQGLFQWVSPSHQVAKVLKFQLQHQSFKWIFRTDFL